MDHKIPIYVDKISISEDKRKLLCDRLIKNHKEYIYTDYNNFRMDESYDEIKNQLYEIIINIARKTFEDLKEITYKDCFAFVSNNKEYRGLIHKHILSDIAAVWYLNVPSKTSGQICFYDDNHRELCRISPNVGDLIIFSSSLNHQPLKSEHDDYRIAINIELKFSK